MGALMRHANQVLRMEAIISKNTPKEVLHKKILLSDANRNA